LITVQTTSITYIVQQNGAIVAYANKCSIVQSMLWYAEPFASDTLVWQTDRQIFLQQMLYLT